MGEEKADWPRDSDSRVIIADLVEQRIDKIF